jgi:hypothetical protein
VVGVVFEAGFEDMRYVVKLVVNYTGTTTQAEGKIILQGTGRTGSIKQ